MHKFKDLKVWEKSVELSVLIYEVTNDFPTDERFGLVSQMRRSAVSVSSNIAEGAGRNTLKDFSHFLNISQGSAFELETQLEISKRLSFIDVQRYDSCVNKIQEIQNMIFGLRRSLKEKVV